MVERVDLLRLSATVSALDSERREWRYDVLTSIVLATLAFRGGLTSRELAAQINASWGTQVVTVGLLEPVLQSVRQAGLVAVQQRFGGTDTWVAADGVVQEVRADQAWVDATLDAYQKEFAALLDEHYEGTLTARRISKLSEQLVAALAAGATDIVRAGGGGVARGVQPVQFDQRAVEAYLRERISPRDLARAMSLIAAIALDSHESFGNDVVRLLMVGAILFRVAGQHDLHAAADLTGTRLALDTSALVYTLQEGDVQGQLIDRLIAESLAMGAEVIVADHTLGEWERLWEAADNEVRHLSDDRLRLREGTHRLVGNPMVRAFVERCEHDSGLTWPRYQIGRRNIAVRLEQAGVRLRPHGNLRPEEREAVHAAQGRLVELSEDRAVRGTRTATAAEMDAESCVMLARWRSASERGFPRAWFVAVDHLTGQIYAELHPEDQFPLTVAPESWLLFLATVRGDDLSEVSSLARALSDSASQNAFLAVATQYTLEEALQLADLLSEGSALSEADIVQAALVGFDELATQAGVASERTAQARAWRVVQARSRRRDARARREFERAREVRSSFDGLVEERARALLAEGEAERAAQIKAEKDRATRANRLLLVTFLAVAAIGAFVFVDVNTALSGEVKTLTLILGAIAFVEGVRYWRDLSVSLWELLGANLLLGLWTLAQWLLAEMLP